MLPAEQFLANVSHELRTPLHGIVGYSQLLSQSKLDSNQLSYLNNINKCCLHLVELVNDILDFSKLTTEKILLNLECFSIQELFDEINSVMQEKLNEKKQKIRFISSFSEPIISDKQKIIQILINLIANANKFTPVNGRIVVTVKSIESNIVQFSVEDDGIGISKEDQKNLFQPFTQLKKNLSSKNNGVGLGLAICKKLVEAMNGTIYIESEEGNGSVFIFNIEHYPLENYEKTIDVTLLQNKTVLIADSNIDSRLNIGEILFDNKINPIICSSAQEALKMIKRYSFFAILIDDNISDPSINKLIKEIGNYDPDIPIIGIGTTNCEFNISKPINRLKILDALCKVGKKLNIDKFQLNEDEEDYKEGKNKILVAEDVPYNLEMIVRMLNLIGYTDIDTCVDGEETIEKLKSNDYSVLLLDLKMPKKDGLEVLEYMKSNNLRYPSGRNYPKVAVITASTLGSDKERCKEYGVKYFLLKPFNSSHLKNIVDRLMKGTIR